MIVRTKDELIRDNLLVKHKAGSYVYGTNIETSDIDYRGIFCADKVNILTPFFPVYEVEDDNEQDTKFLELRHFMKLCLNQNPNVVESLWVSDEDIIFRTPAYELLRNAREQLLSSKIAFTYSGYACAQLSKIKTHNKKLNHNPDLELLCKILKQGIQDGIIDKSFIENQCGCEVMKYIS